MFTPSPDLLAAWQAAVPAPEIMGPEHWARIEAAYGAPLPEAYKAFTGTYGAVTFPMDAPNSFRYLYQDGGLSEYFEGRINSFKDTATLLLNHRFLIADADNEEEEPFFPANMLPFAGDPGQNQILLELGTESPAIWFWEDQPEAFGHGDNTRLGFIAPDLETFINALAG
ncbi:SMI1/KNR4 family protein [Alphaproteobacteria bacterium KMM 3653]|uniref:SMI1/KNR4 family protein n=1 Tax=Harenicola maris TaxID=2841044 RepID=A0AAP2CSR3_9RHOB|nr:SMI1/KNR4 family protein [Harenicola maris]